MSDSANCIAGLIVGALVAGIFCYNLSQANHYSQDLIFECQKDLPRNRYCKLIAVADEGGE